MAIGRISGSVLKSNLTRNGTDLAFETNLLYLDVTNSRIGIGTSSPSTTLDVNGTITGTTVTGGTLTASGTGTSALLTLTTTEASASASPIIALKRNSGSPADSDKLGQLSFLGENDNDQEVEYARIYSSIFDASDGTEDGKIQVQVMKAGTLTNSMRFESEGIFLNTSNTIIFEGATADNYETTLTVVDPTADVTVSLPNATDTLVGKATTDTLTNKTLTAPTVNAGTMTGDFDFADNSKIIMGDGDDLKIYHSGSHSIIQDAGAGYLRIRGSKIQIMGNGNDEMHIVSTENGSAELYYNGTKTFETISTGVQTTGTVNINGAYTFPTSDGSNGQVLQTDGSGTLSFASISVGDLSFVGSTIISPSNADLTLDPSGTGEIAINADTTITGDLTVTGSVTSASTSDSDDTTTGSKTSIGTSATNINTFTTSTYDSAFYLAVTRDEINEEVACDQISLVHNNTTAFVASGGGVRSGDNDQLTYTADINSGTVRLRGTGTSDVNSIKFFRIGLGDDTSAATTGKATTVLNADVDSAVENLDTWAHASYRGAKYYISANNTGKTELQNIECMVVHNGTTAFITTYNDIYTGNNALIALTADISGSDVRLRVSGNEANTAVKLYRILLADDESGATGTNANIIGATTVSSSATTLDSFSSDSYTGVHYIVVGYNSGESGTPGSISEVFTVTDGSGAWVSNSQISTKGTDQITFTAALSGSTVTLSAASTSGGSTTLNAYRVHMLRGIAGASTSIQVLTSNDQTITGTKTFSSPIVLTVGSDPSTVANNAHIYAKDDTSSAEVYVRDEAGNVTKLSPHNKQGEWEYFSRNTKTGKTVRVNMEEMIKDIEKLTGKKYIKEE
jgi:hypothetical protein